MSSRISQRGEPVVAQGIQLHNPAVRDVPGVRDEHILPPKLLRRSERDPMRLYTRVLTYLDHLFSIHNITYLSGQRELLADATEAVLQAVPGTVTAIPFQPGLGKSTLIRALLAVMAQEFQDRTSIAQAIGGVIVVVEKTAEAEELETLCNTHRTERPVAKAVFSPNDYNLALGRCINGTAQSYSECPGRSCRDYALCPLVQSARQTHSTPILIISHARYQHYMENMSALLPWEDESGQYIRTLLLVDELPQLTEDNVMNLRTINQFESMFDQLKPSYQAQLRKAKSTLLYLWHDAIRSPFFRLLHSAPEHCSLFGTVSQQELETAGFTEDRLQKLRNTIVNYTGTEDCGSVHLVDVLLAAKAAYYAVGQDTSFFFPRLKALHGETQPATFLFSGTASLSPELFRNPNIHTFPDKNLESFQRLQINIQRGDLFNSSKSGLEKQQNL